MTTTAIPAIDLLAAAASVRRAATPKRNLTLRDEFGPIRGRRFLEGPIPPAAAPLEDLHGRTPSASALTAWEQADEACFARTA